MSKQEYLFLNLGEAQAAEISQTIANKTAQKILEHLKLGATTESDLSAKLKIPLSTIHYNVQQLVKAGLVVGDQYHYSTKGREVSHYRLTNKVIVIAPQGASGFEQLVKSLVPAALVVAAGTAFVSYLSTKLQTVATSAAAFSQPVVDVAQDVAGQVAPLMMAKSAIIAPTADAAIETAMRVAANETAPAALMAIAPTGVESASAAVTTVAPLASEPQYALWFLAGGLVLIGVSLLGLWLWQRAKK